MMSSMMHVQVSGSANKQVTKTVRQFDDVLYASDISINILACIVKLYTEQRSKLMCRNDTVSAFLCDQQYLLERHSICKMFNRTAFRPLRPWLWLVVL